VATLADLPQRIYPNRAHPRAPRERTSAPLSAILRAWPALLNPGFASRHPVVSRGQPLCAACFQWV